MVNIDFTSCIYIHVEVLIAGEKVRVATQSQKFNCTKGAGASTIAQFKNCATVAAQIDNLRANFKMRSQIDNNFQNALHDLQIGQIVKTRGTYIY